MISSENVSLLKTLKTPKNQKNNFAVKTSKKDRLKATLRMVISKDLGPYTKIWRNSKSKTFKQIHQLKKKPSKNTRQ
jgi:hypothetical protein